MAAKTDLVIVESPAKAGTIGKYLGGGYKVLASMGHLRDLPKSVMGVDIEHGFEPEYRPVKGRETTIEQLRKAAGRSGTVYLATDPDREGEAISWHLKELLELPDSKVRRVTFNEITKNVVCDSIQHPRDIDMDLVDAQQARRILDRIVGYKISPIMWKKIRKGLSAGRVQSVAVRMVVDREHEIRAFVPEEYWILEALLAPAGSGDVFRASFYGKGAKKLELTSAEAVQEVIDAVSGDTFTVRSVKRADKQRSPAAPFITSTLQQEASRRLGMTPRRTMSVAQQLYEGVDINGDSVGLITYMRTDSLRISAEALAAAGRFIRERYGDAYYPGKPRAFKSKNSAQDAHEAIRPTNVFLTPESVKNQISGDQYRLYRLIWNRFIASQMANAVYDSVTADIESAGYVFRASHSTVKFPGHTALYEIASDEEEDARDVKMPALQEGDRLDGRGFEKEQKFTQPPVRYTEATLIKEMDETGVGRPSTYAPTVSTILDREYVVKEGRFLRPTPLGETVTEKFMEQYFRDIVDLKFTARMEEELDDIEKGKKPWKDVLREFYGSFEASLENAEKALEGEHIRVPAEETDEICDLCGAKMVIKSGRFGRFLACPRYPECKFTKPIVVEMPGRCPRCGGRLLKRTSKNGYTYYACEKGAACGFMSWDVPVKDNCPVCGQTMFKRAGKGYKRPFCINEACENFLPEDKRGYKRKSAQADVEAAKDEKKTAAKKPAKKTARRPAAKKTDRS